MGQGPLRQFGQNKYRITINTRVIERRLPYDFSSNVW